MRHVVDQAEFLRLRGDDLLAGENQAERFWQTDEARKTGRAAPRGNDPELRFGQAALCGAIGGGHAPVASERDFETAAEAHAVNRGNARDIETTQAREDAMAVVDQFGKVHGLEGLRVADASIMPDCIRANTNVTVMVIGERVADLIRQGH